jgi:2-hydroxycyclohexanecarboxyl-CoA dehydrogenase
MDTGLAGRTVIVTGATANIGRAIALAFADEGSNVVLVGRDEAQGERMCAELAQRGASRALWCPADVTDREEVASMVAAALDAFGRVDVLVNNVGGNVGLDPFVESDPETWQREISLNFTSTLNCSHAVLPGMIQQGSGRIINIGSTSGLVGDPMLAVYSALKGAVHAFTKVLAKEVGKRGITVNAIAPYGTLPEDWSRDTSAGSRWKPDGLMTQLMATKGELMAGMARNTVLERQYAKPAEIGAAAVYLASDAAAFVTAQILCVDGGTQVA